MRLELTKKTDLAFQALDIIATHGGERVSGARLSDLLDVSSQYLPHVMAPLTRAGWVSSVSGPHGGYLLSVDLHDVSLLQLVEAVEGPVETGRCLHHGPIHGQDANCALHAPWSRAREAMIEELRITRLSDISTLVA